MSLRNGASKDNHHNPNEHLDNNLSTSKSKTRSSVLKPSHSNKSQEKPSSSNHHTHSTAVQTSASRRSYSSHPTSVSTSTTNINNALTTTTSNSFTQREFDLLEVSAWTYDHSRQSPHRYQSSDLASTSHNGLNNSICPYHASMIDACLRSGYGSAPLERWLEEDTSDGGALALQLELQSRVGCTCIALQRNFF